MRSHLIRLAALAAIVNLGCQGIDPALSPARSPGAPALDSGDPIQRRALPAEVIDFEGLPAGTLIGDVFGNGGSGPVHVTATNPDFPAGTNAALIFDSASPTGEDLDLGTPNETFAGPGVGVGGEMGMAFENAVALGNLLIVAEDLVDLDGDGLVDDPDDAVVIGAMMALDFSDVGTGVVTISKLTIVDVEAEEPGALVELFAPGGALITSVSLPQVGDNGVAIVSAGPTSGVERLVVTLNGSGAVDNVAFTPDQPLGEIGDYVWCDVNDDGVQDPDEPGIPGVTVVLVCTAPDGSTLQERTTTDADGMYLFTDLPEGVCVVSVDPATAPDGKEPGSNCPTEMDVDLAPGESFLDADFCFVNVPRDCCVDGKPVSLTMVYTGEDCSATSHSQDPGKVTCDGDPAFEPRVLIRANDDEKPADTGEVFFEGEVDLGGSFDISAASAGRETLKSSTWVHVFDLAGNLLQSVEFHTSCSQPLATGDRFGSLLLSGCRGEDEPPPGQGPSCCENGKPVELEMVYTGEDCSATSHTQDSGKVECDGDPAFEPRVFIRANDDHDPTDTGEVFFEGEVDLDGSFVIDAENAGRDELKSSTWVHVFDLSGRILQSVEFHTSCSQPLHIGNRFGSLLLVGCRGADEPSDPGDSTGNSCADGKPAALAAMYTGADCSATSHAQDAGKVSCEGDPVGAARVRIRSTDKENTFDRKAKVWFDGEVDLGGVFDIVAADGGESRLKTNTWVHVFALDGSLLQVVQFHTSCSQPLAVGNRFGSIDIVGYTPEP